MRSPSKTQCPPNESPLQPLTLFFNIYAHRLCAGGHLKNNNNNARDNVYGAVIMTQVISRVHLVHLTNAGQCQAAADPQTRPTDVGREYTCRLLYGLHMPSPFIITQPESGYSFYRPMEGGRLSQPKHTA